MQELALQLLQHTCAVATDTHPITRPARNGTADTLPLPHARLQGLLQCELENLPPPLGMGIRTMIRPVKSDLPVFPHNQAESASSPTFLGLKLIGIVAFHSTMLDQKDRA